MRCCVCRLQDGDSLIDADGCATTLLQEFSRVFASQRADQAHMKETHAKIHTLVHHSAVLEPPEASLLQPTQAGPCASSSAADHQMVSGRAEETSTDAFTGAKGPETAVCQSRDASGASPLGDPAMSPNPAFWGKRWSSNGDSVAWRPLSGAALNPGKLPALLAKVHWAEPAHGCDSGATADTGDDASTSFLRVSGAAADASDDTSPSFLRVSRRAGTAEGAHVQAASTADAAPGHISELQVRPLALESPRAAAHRSIGYMSAAHVCT
jgi:hypothetical protein